jgi:outer membrane murein-binding lipoprotein Lpp
MKPLNTLTLATTALVITLTLGCDSEGPAEKAGEQIDEAVEELSQPQGTAEQAGEAVDDTVDEAKEELKKASKEAGEAVEEAGEKLQGDGQ